MDLSHRPLSYQEVRLAEDDDYAAVEHRTARLGVGNALDLELTKKLRAGLPCKLTRVELEIALAEGQLATKMSPGDALTYASWMCAAERGWNPVHLETVGDADAGALASPSMEGALGPMFHYLRRESAPAPAARLAAKLKPNKAAPGDHDELLEAVMALVRADGSGEPMTSEVLAAAHAQLGASAARVRVHTSELAHQAAQLLEASAFTIGHDIYFAAGEYAPGTPHGDQLLRHELTHVLQHQRGELAAGARSELLSQSSAAESEARSAEAAEWAGARPSTRPVDAKAEADVDGAREVAPDPPASSATPTDAAPDQGAVLELLRQAGLTLAGADLDHVTRSYGAGLSLSKARLAAADGPAQLAAIVEHAREHACARGCPHPAPPRVESLDAQTRHEVRATTGIELPDVSVERDAVLSTTGRLAEAIGPVIRLAPEVPGADVPLGRKVRLHEAMHVAQQQVHEEQAPADRTAAVESEAHAAASAAERGATAGLHTRAEPTTAYGLGVGEMVAAASNATGIDPLAWIRQHVPAVGQLLSGGFDPLLQRVGQAASGALRPLLDGLDVGSLSGTVGSLLAPIGGGKLAFGVLSGCCECFGEALQKLLTGFQSLLASDGAQGLSAWFAQVQHHAIDGFLNDLTDVFATLRRWGQPLVALIDAVSSGLDAARATLGALADQAWRQLICPPLGLDPTLPPREAINKRLRELWQPVQDVIDQARRALVQLWEKIKQNPVVAKVLKVFDDVRHLLRAIQMCRESQSRDPQKWLAILAAETRGTIFESLIEGLQHGYRSMLDLRDAAVNWLLGVLDELGILGAWNSAVPILQPIGQAIRGFVATVRAAVQTVRTTIEHALTEATSALQHLWDAVRPYLSFAIGFSIAVSALASGNPIPMVTFLAGQAFLALPDCHKTAIADFVLDLFITFVELVPAQLPPVVLVKAAALGFLRTLRGAPAARKIAAMDNLARILSFDVEMIAGFCVGVVEGLWASVLGMVVRIAIWPMTQLVSGLSALGQQAASLSGLSFASALDSLDWLGEALSGATPLPAPGSFVGGPLGGGDGAGARSTRQDVRAIARDAQPSIAGAAPADEAGADAGTEASADAGVGFEAAPTFPELADPTELFNHIFRRGVTRAELESLLARFNAGLETLGGRAGEQAATRLIDFFSDRSTPYRVGEVLGEIVGWLAGEIIAIVVTLGVGAAVLEAARGGALLVEIGMNFPRLLEALNAMRTALQPLLEVVARFGDDFVRLFRRVTVWLDDMAIWAERQLVRLLNWIANNPRAAWRWYRRLRRLWGMVSDDDADLESIAEEAASAAWEELLERMPNEVKDEEGLRALLALVHVARGGNVEIDLQVRHRGDTGWSVRATASANGDSAHADFGTGWIATAEDSGAPWYALEDHQQQHFEMIAEVIAALTTSTPEESSLGPEQAYQAKRRRAETLRTERLARLLRGIVFLINMEEWSGVERDRMISTEFVITPNAQKKWHDIPLTGGLQGFLGAVPTGNGRQFRGHFGSVPDPVAGTVWDWNDGAAYPSGPVTRHPANEHLGYQNHGDLSEIRPMAVPYIFVGGSTGGALDGDKQIWLDILDAKLDRLKQQLLHPRPTDAEPNPTPPTPAAAQAEAEARLLAWYQQSYPGILSMSDLRLQGSGGRRWQAHHVHEHSWGGHNSSYNYQYLPLPAQHALFTAWWSGRQARIQQALFGTS